jgi:MFS family permease
MAALGDFGGPLRDRSFRAIWVSLLASSMGDWVARLALTILVLDRTGSPALSSLVVAVSFVPWIGPGQVLATRLGHLPRVPVMVTADLVRAAVYGALFVHLPVPAILALAFVASLATPPFEAARSALTVEVVAQEHYGPAIALLDLTDQSAVVLGYLVGGVLVLAGGYQLALGVNVATFLVSAASLSRIAERRGRQEPDGTAAQLRRGLRVIIADTVLRRGISVLLVAGVAAVAIEATAAAYARLVLHAGANTTGELAAAVPVGIVVAIPLLPRSGGPRRLLRAAALVAVIGGSLSAAAFSAGHLAGAIVGFFGAGVLTGSVTPAQVAFQPRIPGADRTGVFSLVQGLAMASQGVGAVVGGVLAEAIGPRHGAFIWAAGVVAFSLLSLAVPLVLSDEGGKGALGDEPGGTGGPLPRPVMPEP